MGLIDRVEQFVTGLLNENIPTSYCYHNIRHTEEVVYAAGIIGTQSGISAAEMEVLRIAAWFHDTGFVTTYHGHEEASKNIALKFLERHHYPADKLATVLECIDATRIPQTPVHALAGMLADADLFHLSQKTLFKGEDLLRKEWKYVLQRNLSEESYLSDVYEFITNHEYHSQYGREVLSTRKHQNVMILLKMMRMVETMHPKAEMIK